MPRPVVAQTGLRPERHVGVPMPGSVSSPPEPMPVLSRGKHRSMRKGACFMEMASFLAGDAAILVASEEHVLAVSVLSADRVLAELDGRPVEELEPGSIRALEFASGVAGAEEFVRRAGLSVKGFRRHAAPSTVPFAVRAIAEAHVPAPDFLLRELLTDAIKDCEALCEPGPPSQQVGAAEATEHAEV